MVKGERLSVTLYVQCLSCLLYSASLTCHTRLFFFVTIDIPYLYHLPSPLFCLTHHLSLYRYSQPLSHPVFFPYILHRTRDSPTFPYSSHELPLILQIQCVRGSVDSELTRSALKWQNYMPLHSVHTYLYFCVGPFTDIAEEKKKRLRMQINLM